MQELSHRRLLLLPNSTTTTNITITSTPSKPPSSIDASSATVAAIVLFSFLFFLGFFSLYARRMFSQEQSHQSAASHPGAAGTSKGLDPKAVGSLPILPYSRETYAGTFECVVCLCELEDGESVKVIPNCGHLFHPKCIDAWLVMIGSCPICRTTKIFGSRSYGREVEVVVAAAEGKAGGTGSSGIRSEGCFTVSEGEEMVLPTRSRRL